MAALQTWYWTHTFNWLYAVRGPWGDLPATTLHFWSLAIEEQFYLLWPVVIAVVPRHRFLLVCLLVAGGSAILRIGLVAQGVPLDSANVLTPSRLDALALGSALVAVARTPTSLHRLVQFAAPIALFALFTVAVLHRVNTPVGFGGQVTAIAVMWAGFLILALNSAPVAWVCRQAGLRFLGKYSYGIYVLHPFVRAWFDTYMPQLRGWLRLALLSIVTLSVAVAVYHLWEAPFLRLKRLVPMPQRG